MFAEVRGIVESGMTWYRDPGSKEICDFNDVHRTC